MPPVTGRLGSVCAKVPQAPKVWEHSKMVAKTPSLHLIHLLGVSLVGQARRC
ncbi:hypothetical protein M0657_001659 [Pyricularia oryzae]|uniref:Uncharacterized protein n=1 Tax=Pyricularia oryzae TaxID=318829 RepID=A0A4P7NUQ0_PYROR|nr:hypothetical protein M9X92_001023 [Pyricularia oryzae]KAI7930539.1 hypothetical protein M0657_001659 [Pyricularia oryzae]QBZ66200.1 hypothetical protein PoMZ_13173 [Pyricularia oryzae]